MSDSPFQKVSSRTVYENAWVQVEQHEVEVRATGRRFRYAFLSAPASVMVVAITPAGRVVLVRQYRYPSQDYAYELPGGGSAGLRLRRAAYKELREETGYAASRLRRLGHFVVYCGLSNEVCHVFLASGLRAGRPKPESTEHLTVHEVSYRQLQRMIRRGEFRDGMGLAALHLARPELEKALRTARSEKRRSPARLRAQGPSRQKNR